MRRSILHTTLAAALCVLGLAAPAAADADEEQLAAYCALTVARLELARDTVAGQGRMLNADEERSFFTARGTTAGEYYAFAGENQQALEDYLAEQPEVADRIAALRQEIEALIAAAETAAAEEQ